LQFARLRAFALSDLVWLEAVRRSALWVEQAGQAGRKQGGEGLFELLKANPWLSRGGPIDRRWAEATMEGKGLVMEGLPSAYRGHGDRGMSAE
jgi:hypothetical protein